MDVMTVFDAIKLVNERLESLNKTMSGFHQRNISSMVPEKDIKFLIDQNELMLIALHRIYEGHPLRYKWREAPVEAILQYRPKITFEMS